MAASGTYSYDPAIGEFTDEAFERAGIDPAKLTLRHMRSARRSLNLLFADWANEGVLLFAVDEQTQTLTDGDPSYTVASGTLVMLDAVIRRDSKDTPVTHITRDQYHLIPDKTTEGLPTQVWLDRKAGTYYLWQTPENSTDVLRYWRLRRIQDVTAGSETADVPYRWFEALASGLAAKLSLKFAPTRFTALQGLADSALKRAKAGDKERANTTLSLG